MLGAYLKRGSYITLLFTISSLASRVINFAVLPYLLKYITVEQFGMWDAYQMFFALGTILLSSVASTGLLRFYLLYQGDEQMQKIVVGTTAFLALGMVAIFLLCATCASYYGYIQNVPFVFVLSVASFPLYAYMLAYCRANEMFAWYVALFFIQNSIATGVTLSGASYGYGLNAFFYAHLFSYLPAVCMFFYVIFRFSFFSYAIAKMQLRFIAPLLAYNFLYSSFFTVDRSCLAYYGGFELLGLYGLLFRFAQIFQFFTIALMDATPNIFFKAQHETVSEDLLRKLMTYYLTSIALAAAAVMVATHGAIELFFPRSYSILLEYIPFFLVSLVLLEFARALQIGFNLSCKTFLVPLFGATSLALQSGLFYLVPAHSIYTVYMLNSCAFFFYLLISLYGNYHFYKATFVDIPATFRMTALFFVWCGALYGMQTNSISLLNISLIYVVWLTIFLLTIVYPDDKKIVVAYLERAVRYAERTAVKLCTYAVGAVLSLRVKTSLTAREVLTVSDHSYTDHISGKKIVLIGPKLFPLGGVAVHVDRTKKALERAGNQVILYDSIEHNRYLLHHLYLLGRLLCSYRPNLVIYHTAYVDHALTEGLLLLFFKTYVGYELLYVEHDCRYLYLRTYLYNRIFAWITTHVDKSVYIGSKTYLSHLTCIGVLPQSHCVESAFLPPDSADKHDIMLTYPQELVTFLGAHNPIILANAFQLSRLSGKDLYGFDLCVRAVADLKHAHPTIGCIFALGSKGDVSYFDQLVQQICQYDIKENIFFLMPQKQLWPLFERVDLFVRPTLSDGAAVSIEEALFFSVPVVASDVCVRPNGVTLFKAGDYNDFLYRVQSTLEKDSITKRYSEQQQRIGVI